LLDTQRINHLISPDDVADLKVVVVGLGSGGAACLQPLAMSGIRRWSLFDPDTLDPVNLVKHPATREWIGRPKFDAMSWWLRDRNPAVEIDGAAVDVRTPGLFVAATAGANLVLCAVDDPGVRSWVNAECVRLAVPCLTGSVMRTGLGGQLYLFVPGETGCFACMQLVVDKNNANLEDALDLTDEERHERYGLGNANFTTSGLAIDIQIIAGMHAHMAWSSMLGGRSKYLPKLPFNWLTFGIRPEAGVFTGHYEVRRLLLRPQTDCHLGCAGSDR
jgi:molybdopterin/thiamine biosynthesis adenylyltransferase